MLDTDPDDRQSNKTPGCGQVDGIWRPAPVMVVTNRLGIAIEQMLVDRVLWLPVCVSIIVPATKTVISFQDGMSAA